MNDLQPSTKSEISDCDPRVQLATERTLLAWIRTGLALMAFGFVVARFALILQSLGVQTNSSVVAVGNTDRYLYGAARCDCQCGSVTSLSQVLSQPRSQRQTPFTAWSLAIWVALASAIIGFLLIVYLLLVDVASWRASTTSTTREILCSPDQA